MPFKDTSSSFHGVLETELARAPGRFVETTETKYLVIQQRTLRYQFSLHQHPYVQQLMRRLLLTGTAGLQAADTEYEPRAVSLPGSIDVTLNAGTGVTVGASSRVALLRNAQATSGAVPTALPADMELQTSGATAVTLTDEVRARLAAGMAETPVVGALFSLQGASDAVLRDDTKIVLISDTPLILPDGTMATVPAGTEALLAGETQITIPDGTGATLLSRKARPVLFADFFAAAYTPSTLVQQPYPVKDLDFSSGGAYAIYNWEVFFHVPLTIAIHLSRNQRFAEAQRWFHYLFDPTDDSDGPTPERFWKVRPFQSTDVKKIEEVLVNLVTGADETLRNETVRSIEAWKNAPFRPHVIARYRPQAYMYKTVSAYLDNLIAWGDSLFRQDTGEAIDEAMMVYVLAANILGPRPQPVPKKGTVRPQTYDNLRKDLRQFGTILRDVESDLPFDLMPFPAGEAEDNDRLATLRSLGKALYFCVPRNDKLLSYWDTVADRLFKIRNSLNIQGVFRQLALFAPPIDPGVMARATAAGLDVSAIVSGLNQPLPLVRFQFLVQKATEIVQEVKSLGNSLLSAMEKEDGEAMAILRSKHERAVMAMVEHARYGQLQEAIKSKEALLQTLALAVQRYTYYELQLGKKADEIEKSIPELEGLDRDTFDKMKFAMKEAEVALREIEVDIAQDLAESGGRIVSSHEQQELLALGAAQDAQESAAALNVIAKFLSLIPEMGAQMEPMGVGAAMQFGGRALSTNLSLAADQTSTEANRLSYEAGRSARIGSYARREQDWAFQSNLAAGEISQIFKQLRAAEIREAIADWELKSHRLQMKQGQEIEQFLNEEGAEKKGKKTNKALYAWMKREVRGLYSQSFQFAFDIARKAERALQHELGNPDLSYLQFGYLTGKEGLLAGEKLHLDVKRMEMAYHELNQREYELTKHVSLLQVDPLELIRLRATGRCTVRLPEELFDIDGPGHYFRRIKTVGVSIPCVTGPFTGVHCTLTLVKSSIRRSPARPDQYLREGAEDDRFSDYFGSVQSIVTSSGQNDSGLFETNLRDERYLPFENSGVVSEWLLTLPADPGEGQPAQFDYNTISDVVLHVRYTAREGGRLLRNAAIAKAAEVRGAGTVRLFSVRHEFPTEWAKFQSQVPGTNQRFALALELRKEHYPFWAADGLEENSVTVTRVDLLARSTATQVPASIVVANTADDGGSGTRKDSLAKDASLGNLLVGTLANVGLPATPVGPLRLFLDSHALADLWIAVTWSES